MKNLMAIAAATLLLISCNETDSKTEVITSKDITKLEKQLNLKPAQPDSVQYKLTINNNSFGTVPGPSDYYLEGVLYYNDSIFKRIKEEYNNVDYNTPGFKKEAFNFKWLPQNIKNELNSSPENYSGHPDLFFNRNRITQLWLLKNKVLILSYTN
ncbi:hypothetical protein ABS768_04970 [Flavobacterium sp. ST-75]|uniref:Lipoprotein n=1 Tax=Flavobacterium rhizophilum TaxID=3163296 RepID=A0ABW8YA46_9FLAO